MTSPSAINSLQSGLWFIYAGTHVQNEHGDNSHVDCSKTWRDWTRSWQGSHKRRRIATCGASRLWRATGSGDTQPRVVAYSVLKTHSHRTYCSGESNYYLWRHKHVRVKGPQRCGYDCRWPLIHFLWMQNNQETTMYVQSTERPFDVCTVWHHNLDFHCGN